MIPCAAMPRVITLLGLLVGLTTRAGAQNRVQAVDTLWATVHNHRVAFFAMGDTALPAVVLEPGGASHVAWGDLPAETARFARVMTYDRPGYDLSENCSRPRSATVIAEELREALTVLGIKPPLTLVGWSLGGSFVRVFGAKYPVAVAGLVLIDPAPEEFYVRVARDHAAVWQPMLEEQNRRVASRAAGHQAEWAAWDSTMAETRRSDRGLTAPVVLLTATRAEDQLQPIWIDEHKKWARRMPNVRHIVVEGAGHAIYRDSPVVVLEAIRETLAKTRR
jgi:pimeloyl-ACP methyl ester carboxylesterase